MISGHRGQNVQYPVVVKVSKQENETALPLSSDTHQSFHCRNLVETIQVPRWVTEILGWFCQIINQIEPCYTDICLEPIKSFHAGPYNIRDPDARFLTTTTTLPVTTTTSTTSTTTTTTPQWKPVTHMSTSTTMTTTTVNKTAVIIKVSIFYFFLPVIGFLVLLAILVWCCGKETETKGKLNQKKILRHAKEETKSHEQIKILWEMFCRFSLLQKM